MLETLGNLGDFIGGIAVVVTLAYLALQIRQNTQALCTASRQAVASGYRDANRLFMEPRAALAFAKGLTAFPNLPFEQRNFFGTIVNDIALFMQGAFAAHEAAQLDDSTFAAYLEWFCSVVATPGGDVWWVTIGRPIFEPRMVAAVDARLAAGGLPDIRELAQFQPDEPH